jgi:hypothetical protein
MVKMLILIWSAPIVIKKLTKIICSVGSLNTILVPIVVGRCNSLNLEILPKELQELVVSLEDLINSHYSNRSRTLPARIVERKQNTIITWNIYPEAKIQLEDLFQIITKTIESSLKNINGEIIYCTLTNGEIRDRGAQEFQIHKGRTWEIYLYDPETYIALRLFYESRISHPQDKWLSIDIDIVEESAWFT